MRHMHLYVRVVLTSLVSLGVVLLSFEVNLHVTSGLSALSSPYPLQCLLFAAWSRYGFQLYFPSG